MKIQCNVCESAEAQLLCCADEAALCLDCDRNVHAANKLAGKHQRLPLSASSSDMPKCDICQESVGYFFCLEDRALFCRKCDLAIHTANPYVSVHQRFLLTGVKVGLEATEPAAAPTSSAEKVSEPKSRVSVSKRDIPIISVDEYKISSVDVDVRGVQDLFPPPKVSFTGGSVTEAFPQWHDDEYIGMNDFHHNYDYMGNGSSSKADSGKFSDSDSPILRSGDQELDDGECLGQVPEASWTVPEIPSPPTASGLHWPRSSYSSSDIAVFVPDVSFSQMQTHSGSIIKRRRQF